MKRPVRLSLVLLMLLAALPLATALLAPAAPGASPYLSAISDLGTSAVMADRPCPRRQCDGTTACKPGIAQRCKLTGQGCTTELCNQ